MKTTKTSRLVRGLAMYEAARAEGAVAEPNDRERELGKDGLAYGWSSNGVTRLLARYRVELQEQHRRELADAEQDGYERGRRDALRRDHG